MRRAIFLACLVVGTYVDLHAHNVGNAITWNREISRIMYQRCASCHREGGSAFSLMRYQDLQPRAVEIKDAVLSRRMPPWGAVKGFGDFRNDQGLTQAELDLITDWVDSDTPRGKQSECAAEGAQIQQAIDIQGPKGRHRFKRGSHAQERLHA
jgi:hypothetical protein